MISIVGTACFNKELVLNKVQDGELYGFAFESSNENMNRYKGNVMTTSQYAWYTKEALENCIEIWVQSIEGIVTGKNCNQVN